MDIGVGVSCEGENGKGKDFENEGGSIGGEESQVNAQNRGVSLGHKPGHLEQHIAKKPAMFGASAFVGTEQPEAFEFCRIRTSQMTRDERHGRNQFR